MNVGYAYIIQVARVQLCITCGFTTSVEISQSSYTTSWKPYYKNPGYVPGIGDEC